MSRAALPRLHTTSANFPSHLNPSPGPRLHNPHPQRTWAMVGGSSPVPVDDSRAQQPSGSAAAPAPLPALQRSTNRQKSAGSSSACSEREAGGARAASWRGSKRAAPTLCTASAPRRLRPPAASAHQELRRLVEQRRAEPLGVQRHGGALGLKAPGLAGAQGQQQGGQRRQPGRHTEPVAAAPRTPWCDRSPRWAWVHDQVGGRI